MIHHEGNKVVPVERIFSNEAELLLEDNQLQGIQEDGKMNDGDRKPKRRRMIETEESEPRKILGSRIYGHEIENIDWDEERRKRKEYLEQEEKKRKERIAKAKRLETSWQLMRECQRQIRENSNMWRDRRIQILEEKQKQERLERARGKQQKMRMMEEEKGKRRRIDDLMMKLPTEERKKLELEERRRERLDLKEIEENL